MATESLICGICGYENDSSAKLCVRCQSALQLATRNIAPPDQLKVKAKGGKRHLSKQLYLHIHGGNEFITVDLEEGGTLLIGRYDTQTGQSPEIDLSEYGAAEKGVSRHHAELQYANGILRILDLSSANFTYLNNQKLYPNQSRIVRDADEIRCGHLIMTVQFGESGQ